VWYPMTVCTNSYYQKQIIKASLEETGDPAGISFKLHDFGFRGVSSMETAGLGAAAHLVNFLGTDTVAGLLTIRRFYGDPTGCAGYSIPASEHSTITSWGKEGEVDAMRNMLTKYPTGLVACVSDSYDIYKACSELWGGVLKEEVVNRDGGNGTLVVRPDSGDPKTVVLECLNRLGEAFGTTTNEKGYKVLPSCIRLIQGDGVSYEAIAGILAHLKENGWSSDNVGYGSGGALLQRVDRDTQKCAFKCCHIDIEGVGGRDVFKQPITDPGKNSKKGYLYLHRTAEGKIVTVARHEGDKRTVWTDGVDQEAANCPVEEDEAADLLVTVFENGELKNETTFPEIRDRSNVPYPGA